jgi:acyl dehydratase
VRCFEDLRIGEGGEFGAHKISAEEIIEFARRYDPQPFHTDPVAARDSIYGGLIASGLHSVAIMTRLIIDGWMNKIANLGSPGLDAIRLSHPVRPGDELRARAEVLDLRPSRTRPDRGIVHYAMQLWNQHDEVVVDSGAVIFVRRREGG